MFPIAHDGGAGDVEETGDLVEGQPREGVQLDEALGLPALEDPMLVALDECLNDLAEVDERGAKIVELHAFTGLTFDEIAGLLDVSRATVM
ncbi:MAG: ECF-type sigma factor, partial [Acidobacteriota bacterium]